MNIQQFKKLIAAIKEDVPCPFCNTIFQSHHIHLIAALPYEMTFFVDCHRCLAPILVHVTFKKTAHPQKASFSVQPLGKVVSINEILDMHNFLKEFKGDLSEYLKINQE